MFGIVDTRMEEGESCELDAYTCFWESSKHGVGVAVAQYLMGGVRRLESEVKNTVWIEVARGNGKKGCGSSIWSAK